MNVTTKILIWVSVVALSVLALSLCAAKTENATLSEYGNFLNLRYSEKIIEENQEILKSPDILNFQANGKLEMVETNIKEVFRRAPLNDTVLLHHVVTKLARDYTFEYSDVYDEVLLRNPRNRSLLRRLLQQDIQTSDYNTALSRIDLLLRIDTRNSEEYYGYLSNIFESEKGRKIIIQSLGDKPFWEYSFLQVHVSKSPDENLSDLMPLILAFSSENDEWVAFLRKHYLQRLERSNFLFLAHDFWSKVTDKNIIETFSSESLNFNPEFHNLDVLPPFNWRGFPNESKTVDPLGSKGLYLSYTGSSVALMLNQYVKNTDLTARLIVFEIQKIKKQPSSKFELRVSCGAGIQDILRVEMNTTLNNQRYPLKYENITKSECPFLNVQILAIPSSTERRMAATIKEIRLMPEDLQK